MGIYYHLYNDTKKEIVHWDSHIKEGPMRNNSNVGKAMMNYMMNNRGDILRMVSDVEEDYPKDYRDVDLSKEKPC